MRTTEATVHDTLCSTRLVSAYHCAFLMLRGHITHIHVLLHSGCCGWSRGRRGGGWEGGVTKTEPARRIHKAVTFLLSSEATMAVWLWRQGSQGWECRGDSNDTSENKEAAVKSAALRSHQLAAGKTKAEDTGAFGAAEDVTVNCRCCCSPFNQAEG